MHETPPPGTLRLFVAIGVPESVKAEMEKAQAEFRQALPGGCIRFAKRDQLHLTLRFLGSVATAQLDKLTCALVSVCRDFAPLSLTANGIGFFPNARSPRVIWVGVKDQKADLTRLQAAVQDATRPFSAEPAGKMFTGHVTLGRAKMLRRSESRILEELAEGMRTRCFGEWTASTVHLFRSDLLSGGAQHTMIAEASLALVSASARQTNEFT
jgi:2'-5' RNA ligase